MHNTIEAEESQDEAFDEDKFPSKSQIKRELLELQKLGVRLTQLSNNQLNQLKLDDKLLHAVNSSHSISSNSASKRHRQYIGKLISHLQKDELEAIQAQIQVFDNAANLANKHFHLLEQYRDKLLIDGDKAINELLIKHPNLERSRLRLLVRNANKETEKNQPPKSSRILFKYLKENMEP